MSASSSLPSTPSRSAWLLSRSLSVSARATCLVIGLWLGLTSIVADLDSFHGLILFDSSRIHRAAKLFPYSRVLVTRSMVYALMESPRNSPRHNPLHNLDRATD